MAHSIQSYRGRSVVLNDFDLIIVVLFAVEVVGERQQLRELGGVAGIWREDLVQYGPGTIDMKLDEVIQSNGDRQRMLNLFAAVCEKLDTCGDAISSAWLAKRCPVPGVIPFDYKPDLVKEAIAQLKALIDNENPRNIV